jgi:hypothetical protein
VSPGGGTTVRQSHLFLYADDGAKSRGKIHGKLQKRGRFWRNPECFKQQVLDKKMSKNPEKMKWYAIAREKTGSLSVKFLAY